MDVLAGTHDFPISCFWRACVGCGIERVESVGHVSVEGLGGVSGAGAAIDRPGSARGGLGPGGTKQR